MPKCLQVMDMGPNKAQLCDFKAPPLESGQVLIQTQFSSINYKDALAVTGKGKILRQHPLIPGIDCCGKVIETQSARFQVGDLVYQTGGNLGETYNGGLSEQVVLSENHCLKLPEGLTAEQIMVIGTAGFTAALALLRMEINTLKKTLPIAVTGASGGVGSFAVQLLNKRGYEVIAYTSKEEEVSWLKQLGAAQVDSPKQLLTSRPLDSALFSGAIDNLGGEYLSSLLAKVDIYGQVAAIGLASGFGLNTTVMPFILRGVNLLGISSNNCPKVWREKIWSELATSLKPNYLHATHTIYLDQVMEYSNLLIDRKLKGRILVKF